MRVCGSLDPYKEPMARRLAGFQPWNETLAIEGALLLNGVFEAWVYSGENDEAALPRDAPWKVGPSLAAARGLARANPALWHWNVDAIETVGCLRLAGAHPAERTHQLKRAVKNEPNKKPMDVHAAALRRTSAILDERIGLGTLLSDAVEVLIAGSAARPRSQPIATPPSSQGAGA